MTKTGHPARLMKRPSTLVRWPPKELAALRQVAAAHHVALNEFIVWKMGVVVAEYTQKQAQPEVPYAPRPLKIRSGMFNRKAKNGH